MLSCDVTCSYRVQCIVQCMLECVVQYSGVGTYGGHVGYVHYANIVLLLEHVAHLHCDVARNIDLSLVLEKKTETESSDVGVGGMMV